MAKVELGRCCDVPIEKESRDPECDSTIRRSPGTLGGEEGISPSGNASERGGTASQGTEELTGAITSPCSLT